jgi:hypothetical protein
MHRRRPTCWINMQETLVFLAWRCGVVVGEGCKVLRKDASSSQALQQGREPVLQTNLKAKLQPSPVTSTCSGSTTPACTTVHAHCHDHVQTETLALSSTGKPPEVPTISLHKDVAAKRDALTIPSPTEAPGAREQGLQLSSSNATSASTCKRATSKPLRAAEP